jgi:tRNA(fMet)-specific endonuclease VapC
MPLNRHPLGAAASPLVAFSAPAVQSHELLRLAQEAAGTPIGPPDTLIAATALRHHTTLVTPNVREFTRVPGLHCIHGHDDSPALKP